MLTANLYHRAAWIDEVLFANVVTGLFEPDGTADESGEFLVAGAFAQLTVEILFEG